MLLPYYISSLNLEHEYYSRMSEYEQYEQYLFKMRQVIKRAHRVLNEGRFFVINTAPVLLRRASRNEISRTPVVSTSPALWSASAVTPAE